MIGSGNRREEELRMAGMTLVVAAAIALATSVATAADGTRFRGAAIGDTESSVRAAFAESECRPVRTSLSRHACTIRTSAWGAPVLAMFVFQGDPERRLVVISLTFEPARRDSLERALVDEYGPPDAVTDGQPSWTRPDAVVWIHRDGGRLTFARRDHVEQARGAAPFPCDPQWPEHVNARLNCVPPAAEPPRR
jgi:hypothetical protein